MSVKSSTLLGLLLLVLVGVSLRLLLVDSSDTGTEDLAVFSGSDTPDPPRTSPSSELTTPDASQPERDVAPSAPTETRKNTPIPRASLSGAIWIEGRVEFPPNTPADEVLHVVARGKKFKGKEEDPARHRARVEPSGRFRVAFAKGTRRGRLGLEGKYLYLEGTEKLELRKLPDSILLQPKLGGCFEITVIPPTQAELSSEEAESIDITGYLESNDRFGTGRSAEYLGGQLFQLGGLQTGPDYRLSLSSGRFVDQAQGDLGIKAGEVTPLEMELETGVRVAGRILDPESQPIVGAMVVINSPEDWEQVLTDDAGRFDHGGLDEGKIEISVSKDGFLGQELDPLVMGAGELRDDIEVTLDLGLTLTGRVQWPDGSGVPEAKVVVDQEGEGVQSGWFNGDDRSVVTEPDGSFTMTGMRDELCKVEVRAQPDPEPVEGESERSRKRRKKRMPYWHAELEGVVPGATALTLTLRPGSAVRGTVVDDRGEPLKSFRVSANVGGNRGWNTNQDQSVTHRFRGAEDGAFELEGLKEGRYSVTASASKHASSAEVNLVIPWDGRPLDLVLAREASVSGIVQDTEGNPLDGAKVSKNSRRGWGFGAGNGGARTDETGAFTLKGVSPGKLKISAEATDFADSEWAELTVAPAEELTGVVLRMRVPARITGEIHRGVGDVAELGVNLNSLEGGNWDSKESDSNGEFEFEGLTPGRYAVSFDPDMSDVDEDSDAYWTLQNARRRPEEVEVREGETVHVILGAPPESPVRITGVVTSAGEPVPELAISVKTLEGQNSVAGAETDATGAYSLTVDGAGGYQFTLGSGWGESLVFDREIPEQEAYELDFEMPTSTLSGTVMRADGAPHANTRIYLQLVTAEAGAVSTGISGQRIEETGDNGEYTFTNLPSGTYALRAGGLEYWERGDGDRAFGRALIGDIVIKQGESHPDVNVTLRRAGKVRGTVLNAAGQPAQGVRVQAKNQDGLSYQVWGDTVTDFQGSFELLGLPPEKVVVHAEQGERLATTEARVIEDGSVEVEIILD